MLHLALKNLRPHPVPIEISQGKRDVGKMWLYWIDHTLYPVFKDWIFSFQRKAYYIGRATLEIQICIREHRGWALQAVAGCLKFKPPCTDNCCQTLRGGLSTNWWFPCDTSAWPINEFYTYLNLFEIQIFVGLSSGCTCVMGVKRNPSGMFACQCLWCFLSYLIFSIVLVVLLPGSKVKGLDMLVS